MKKSSTQQNSHRFDIGLGPPNHHIFCTTSTPLRPGWIHFASRKMFKPSQPMMARLRLTTKQVNRGYYKGTRSGSMGFFYYRNYIIDWRKVRTYVVPPGLEEFKVSLPKNPAAVKLDN